MSRLDRAFFARDTLSVAHDLVGCHLVRRDRGQRLEGRIVEVEAYHGEDDPACHAAAGRTLRTRPLYGAPGFAYIYLIYGMYHCLNAVTRGEGLPSAVLIRALEPVAGLDRMRTRRSTRRRRPVTDRELTNGPGKLCQAFGLGLSHNELDLTGDRLWIENGRGEPERVWSPRVGINVGTDRYWRCFEVGSPYVSRSPLNRDIAAAARPRTMDSIAIERATS